MMTINYKLLLDYMLLLRREADNRMRINPAFVMEVTGVWALQPTVIILLSWFIYNFKIFTRGYKYKYNKINNIIQFL